MSTALEAFLAAVDALRDGWDQASPEGRRVLWARVHNTAETVEETPWQT